MQYKKMVLISSIILSASVSYASFYINPTPLGSGKSYTLSGCDGQSSVSSGAAAVCTNSTFPADITITDTSTHDSCSLNIQPKSPATGTCQVATQIVPPVAGKTFIINGGMSSGPTPTPTPTSAPTPAPIPTGFQSVVIQYPPSLLDSVDYPIYVFAQYGSGINGQPTANDRLPLGVVSATANGLSTVGFVNTGGKAVALYFYATSGQSYKQCSINISNKGAITTNTCTGTISMTGETNSNVTVLGFGQSSFQNIEPAVSLPSGTSKANNTISRTIEVENNTKYQYICLKKGTFSATSSELGTNCKAGAGEINTVQGDYLAIKKGASADIDVTAALNSIGWGVLGYTNNVNSWNVSGYSLNANPDRELQPGAMGTLLEYTTYATGTKQSTGVSDIDISMVNGFNIGLSVYPKDGGVCINGAGSGSKPGAGVYNAIYGSSSQPIVKIPNDDTSLSDICPSGDYSVSGVGCMSACSYANAYENSDHQELSCCSGSFGTPGTCITKNPPSGYGTSPAYSLYNTQLHANSTNAYTFAYDDIYGNFSCDPKLSFVFDITNIY